MPITADILSRRASGFVLWCPRQQSQPPQLVIGRLTPGNPPVLSGKQQFALALVTGFTDLWFVSAASCKLQAGTAYHYWFQVDDSRSQATPPARISVTDPFACSVDWRLFPPDATDSTQPASVIIHSGGGKLIEGDSGGETAAFTLSDKPDQLASNNQLVIYELPCAWALSRSLNQPERDVATFQDVAAMVDERIGGANFAELSLLDVGQAYLADLGVNALELLPPADSFFKRQWGYGTSHYLAPDAELGYPEGDLSPTANRDLAQLVDACHRKNIRFFIDSVMAFAHEEPYNHIDAPDFCIDNPQDTPGDPDAMTSQRADGSQALRNGFGSTLWRYEKPLITYDPISGTAQSIYPARQLMLTYLTRWMRDFRVDGVRIDSCENIACWDFLQSFRDTAYHLWTQRWTAAGLTAGPIADSRFLVVGEELSLPPAILQQKRVDALWNEDFQARVRAMVLGQGASGDNFLTTVMKAIDCRQTGIFTSGTQAINYITKHDVEGFRHERLFTMLRSFAPSQIEERIKLAFVCLMTAVGIPMFLAGEEFADQHDFFDENGNVSQNGGKQINPVNFGRLTAAPSNDLQGNPDGFYAPMRQRIFQYVKTLIHLRTTSSALAVDDTTFFWSDFGAGKQVVAWRRGSPTEEAPIIVVANFSDFTSAAGAGYVIPTWPGPAPAGKKWIEITQGYDVTPAFVGQEAIFPWEAKVYTLANQI